MILGSSILELNILCETMCSCSLKNKCLFLISQEDLVSPKVLISKLDVVKSNIASLCKNLESEKLIVKKQDDKDRRGIYYSITESGHAHLNGILNDIEKQFRISEQNTAQTALQNAINALRKKV